jgi:hypothetical protein
MSNFVLTNQDKAGIQTPDSGQTTIFVDLDKRLKAKLDNGTIVDYGVLSGQKYHFVEYLTLSSGNIASKQITLSHSPLEVEQVMLDVLNNGPQYYDYDFTVSGSILSWSGKPLDGILSAGDKLRIQYYY